MPHICRIALFPLIVAVAISAEEKSSNLPKQSPFNLRGGPAAPAAAASETIEFAGVSSVGTKTDLIFYDKTAKKSHWITRGETKEGISVIDYHRDRDEVVVKINGVQKTLALRKVAAPTSTPRAVSAPSTGFNSAAPAFVPGNISALPSNAVAAPLGGAAGQMAPQPAPAPGSPAEVQKKQETEARMLVSDLLEIGMAQRRAYEEAQRKAADGTASAAAPADAAQPAANQTATPSR